MYNAIDRRSGLFTPSVSDELNNAFSKTLEQIENFKPTDLEPKRSTGTVAVNSNLNFSTLVSSSFIIGSHEVWMNVTFVSDDTIESGTEIGETSVSTQMPVLAFLTSDDTALPCKIEGTKITVYGEMTAKTRYYLATWFIV